VGKKIGSARGEDRHQNRGWNLRVSGFYGKESERSQKKRGMMWRLDYRGMPDEKSKKGLCILQIKERYHERERKKKNLEGEGVLAREACINRQQYRTWRK